MNFILTVFRLLMCALVALGALKVVPYTPSTEEFVPVLRFAVISDVHIKSENCIEYQRLQKMFDSVYSYAGSQEYSNVDAFAFAGDSVNYGTQEQWGYFMDVVNDKIRDESEFIICYAASHDCSGDTTLDVCEKMTGVAPNSTWNINGFDFITVSQSSEQPYISSNRWLNNQLKAVTTKNPDKPVFVFQHLHVMGTVYGSIGWGTPILSPVLNNYPQVIDFSGHSHYPINDPRSIDQKYFTAVGTGTLSYLELESGMTYGSVPPGSSQVAQFHIVEVDAQNRVRIMPYNLTADSFFKEPGSYSDEQLIYYVDNAADRSSYIYTPARYATADVPIFPEDSQISFSDITGESALINFTQALDGECTHHYAIKLYINGIIKKTYNIWSEYYFEPMPDNLTYKMEGLKAGKTYDVKITAYDSYGMASQLPLTGTFTTAT